MKDLDNDINMLLFLSILASRFGGFAEDRMAFTSLA